MSLIQSNGTNALPCHCAAEAIYNGYVYKDSGTSGRLTAITAKGDAALAVADRSTLDPDDGTAEAMTAGYTHPFWILGCGAVVEVASVTSTAYTFGCKVYLDDSVNGQVCATAATSTPIGRYWGVGETTASAGQLIPVLLCEIPDAATE